MYVKAFCVPYIADLVAVTFAFGLLRLRRGLGRLGAQWPVAETIRITLGEKIAEAQSETPTTSASSIRDLVLAYVSQRGSVPEVLCRSTRKGRSADTEAHTELSPRGRSHLSGTFGRGRAQPVSGVT